MKTLLLLLIILGSAGREARATFPPTGRDACVTSLAAFGHGVAGGEPASAIPAGAWPALLLAQSSSIPSALQPSLIQFATFIGCVLALLMIAVLVTALLKNARDLRSKPEPTRLQQPITIQKVEEFVTVPTFNEKITEIGDRCEKLEKDFHDVLVDPKGYLHTFVHGVDGELKALYKAGEQREERLRLEIGAVDKRVNTLAENVGKAVGTMNESNKTLRTLSDELMKKALNAGGQA
jgi:hypothetical protein